ncbi:MAG: hypothetical protein EBV03_07950 [Proteobacteria bacterium]|nr:hypothetical protein [Pseudomonadota bacterium]
MAPRKIPLPTASGDNDESYDLGAGRMQVDETTGAPPPIQRLPNTPPAIPSRRNLPDLNSIYRRAPQDADEVYQPPKGMIGGNDAEDYHQLYNNF